MSLTVLDLAVPHIGLPVHAVAGAGFAALMVAAFLFSIGLGPVFTLSADVMVAAVI